MLTTGVISVTSLGFDLRTLALKGRNRHNEPAPIFRDFFILSHFPTLHCTDTFHMDPVFVHSLAQI